MDDDSLDPLLPQLQEANELYVRTISRLIRKADIQRFREFVIYQFLLCMDVIPEKVALRETPNSFRLKNPYVPGEVLSAWHLKRGFVDANGNPLPLLSKGKDPSFYSLVRIVDPNEDPAEVLKYLLSIGDVRKVGNRYLPLGRFTHHRNSPRFQGLHQFSALLKFLRALERNALKREALRTYQFTTDGTVPKKQFKKLRRAIHGLLNQAILSSDEAVFRLSAGAKPGDSTEAVTIGAFMSDGRRVRSIIQRAEAARGPRRIPRRGVQSASSKASRQRRRKVGAASD